MKTKKKMKEVRVVPRALAPLVNGEAARPGEALQAQNVRESESSLQVTGEPVTRGAVAVGDRLLLITCGHTVTCRDTTVKIDGNPVASLAATVVGAHTMGDVIVVVATDGLTYLAERDSSWIVLDPANAMPQLSIGTSVAVSGMAIEAYSFDQPYNQWQAPLADADRTELTARLRAVWSALSADIRAEGRYLAPLLVRWAVRLTDGSYLWMSEPVRVGDATLGNADRIAAAVTTSGSAFTGIEASTLALTHYAMDIGVTTNIGDEWLPLVASIDVFATDEAQLLTANPSLDYRCVTRTVGGHEYLLEMGLSRRSAHAVARQLAASPWHLVARAPAAPRVTANDFAVPDETLTMTNAACDGIGTMLSLGDVVSSTMAGGRLYCCTREGDVVVSMAGNALAEAHRRRVTGALPLAMAVVMRPLYSSGFGRYPVYVFTDDGVYAIPQSATGILGEPRLVDRTVIAADVAPVEGGGTVWLVSRHRHLCRLDGSRLTVCHDNVDCTAMAWSDAWRELWLLPASGFPMVMMTSGRLCLRTVPAAQLYSDPRHAFAVTDVGNVLDLEHEQAVMMPLSWHSHPIDLHPLMGVALRRVVWHLSGNDVNLTLRVLGQRGIMSGNTDVSVMTVQGAVEQPLALPTVAMPARTMSLQLDGMATAGTLILPTLLYYT